MKKLSNKVKMWGIGSLVVAFFMLIALITCIERVEEGHVSVVYTVGDGAKEVLGQGWHLVGLLDKTYTVSVRPEVVDSHVEVTTSDGKKITMAVKYTMYVQESSVLDLFKKYGNRESAYYTEKLLQQYLFTASRNVVSGYSVLDIFGTKTNEASERVNEMFAKQSAIEGFVVSNTTLGNPEIDADTQKAIDMRIQASQEHELEKQKLENAKLQAETKAIIAKGEADKLIIETQANADAVLIESKAQAEANETLSKSLTENILKQMEMEARKTHGWIEIQGMNGSVLVENK